jgi:predicted alpha/beta-fold hydrolase
VQPFEPLVSHPHLLTIAAHFWPRELDERRFPVERRLYRTEPDVQVLVEEQRPAGEPRGRVLIVHGLEGSSRSGYMLSMARAALEAGFSAHRLNLRSCGGTETLCRGGYHSGLTVDLHETVRRLAPAFVVGFSLGGNLALKLAGELEETSLIQGVCAVSTPIDLAACVDRLDLPENRFYRRRFLRRLKRRARAIARAHPGLFSLEGLESVRSLREFDDRYTARWFGFRDAADYYATQSCLRILGRVRVPALLIQAQDDPVIPFGIFSCPALRENPAIELVAPEHGGHVGFLSRRQPRFWSEHAVMEWIEKEAKRTA